MASTHHKYPWLTGLIYSDKDRRNVREFVGIIHNVGRKTTSLYDYGRLRDSDDEKRDFIEAGRRWWSESNRQLPISYCMPRDMDRFRYALIHLTGNRVTFLFGPETSLTSHMRRGKARTHKVTLDDEGNNTSTTVIVEDGATGAKSKVVRPARTLPGRT